MKAVHSSVLYLSTCFLLSCTSSAPEQTGAKPALTDSSKTMPVSVVDTTPAFGIDVAKYQGNLVSEIGPEDKLDFIICKATEGITYVDPDFTNNWQTINSKGLIRGAYHFYRSNDDPQQQAQFFAKTLNGLNNTDLPPVLDIEGGGLVGNIDAATLQKDVLTFLQNLEVLCKRKPVIYTGLNFANQYLSNNTALATYPLWIAEYNGKSAPVIPDSWKQNGYVIWQKSDKYDVHSDTTDFDTFNGHKQGLLEFIRQSSVQ